MLFAFPLLDRGWDSGRFRKSKPVCLENLSCMGAGARYDQPDFIRSGR
jgi:hypothetical protein